MLCVTSTTGRAVRALAAHARHHSTMGPTSCIWVAEEPESLTGSGGQADVLPCFVLGGTIQALRIIRPAPCVVSADHWHEVRAETMACRARLPVNHPAITPMQDLGALSGEQPIGLMPWRSVTLQRYTSLMTLARGGVPADPRLQVSDLPRLLTQLGAGMRAAADRDVAHGDVGRNIMFIPPGCKTGPAGHATLVDWDTAYARSSGRHFVQPDWESAPELRARRRGRRPDSNLTEAWSLHRALSRTLGNRANIFLDEFPAETGPWTEKLASLMPDRSADTPQGRRLTEALGFAFDGMSEPDEARRMTFVELDTGLPDPEHPRTAQWCLRWASHHRTLLAAARCPLAEAAARHVVEIQAALDAKHPVIPTYIVARELNATVEVARAPGKRGIRVSRWEQRPVPHGARIRGRWRRG